MTPRIAIDAMGGDDAPAPVVTGAVKAADLLGVEIILVGDRNAIADSLGDGAGNPNLRIVHAPDVIAMGAHPTEAVKGQPEASMNVAVRLVKNDEADAFVSNGNTGAAMATALLTLGRVRGIGRPALATVFPTGEQTREIILDIGANAEGRPIHLAQFAHMGSAYMELIYGMDRPRVALLSNGSEETKGDQLVLETAALLRESELNFIGNVEGNDLTQPKADVIVTDGFTGNVLLKTAEAVSELMITEIRAAFTAKPWNRVAALVLQNDLRAIRKRIDYTEYGGAQLLGVNGVTVIGHGRSNAVAVFNAIRAARDAVRSDLLGTMRRIGREMPARAERNKTN